MKKNANLSMRTNIKSTKKKNNLTKQIDVVKNWPQSKPKPRQENNNAKLARMDGDTTIYYVWNCYVFHKRLLRRIYNVDI